MSALICGSMAYDTIMVFHDKFKNHILPEKVHILNVSFLVPVMRREYGGCAGNIAYNLNLLGEEALAMAVVGHDFEPYSQWMSQNGLSSEFIYIMDNHYTGQAYITTDEEGNQITAFHPGAMSFSHLNSIPTDNDIEHRHRIARWQRRYATSCRAVCRTGHTVYFRSRSRYADV